MSGTAATAASAAAGLGNFMGSIGGSMVDAQLMTKMGEALEIITLEDGYLWFPVYVVMAAFRLISLVAMRWAVGNSNTVLEKAGSLGWFFADVLFYTRTEISSAVSNTEDGQLAALIRENPSGQTTYMVPVFWTEEKTSVKVHTARVIHRSLLTKLRVEARERMKSIGYSRACFYRLVSVNKTLSYVTNKSNRLYASKQVVDVCSMVESIVEAQTREECYSVRCVRINGEPGLGKSFCVHEIVNRGLVKQVLYVNLSLLEADGATSITDIVETAFFKKSITESTVFVLDELDKLLDEIVTVGYQRYKASFGNNAQTKAQPLTEEEYVLSERTKCYKTLLRVIEREGIEAPCVLLLLSNNFKTIYNGMDMTHLESLESRVNDYTFKRCDYEDVVGYLRYKNEAYQKSDKLGIKDPQKLEAILKRLNCKISIPYRLLGQIFEGGLYDFSRTVDRLNQWWEEQPEYTPVESKVELVEVANPGDDWVVVQETPTQETPDQETAEPIIPMVTIKYHSETRNPHPDTVSIHTSPYSKLYQCRISRIVGDGPHKCMSYDLLIYSNLEFARATEYRGLTECPNKCENIPIYQWGEYTLCTTCINQHWSDCVGRYLCDMHSCVSMMIGRSTADTILKQYCPHNISDKMIRCKGKTYYSCKECNAIALTHKPADRCIVPDCFDVGTNTFPKSDGGEIKVCNQHNYNIPHVCGCGEYDSNGAWVTCNTYDPSGCKWDNVMGAHMCTQHSKKLLGVDQWVNDESLSAFCPRPVLSELDTRALNDFIEGLRSLKNPDTVGKLRDIIDKVPQSLLNADPNVKSSVVLLKEDLPTGLPANTQMKGIRLYAGSRCLRLIDAGYCSISGFI